MGQKGTGSQIRNTGIGTRFSNEVIGLDLNLQTQLFVFLKSESALGMQILIKEICIHKLRISNTAYLKKSVAHLGNLSQAA
jgi:hypothetical protein